MKPVSNHPSRLGWLAGTTDQRHDLLNSKTLGGIGLVEHWQWNPSDQITKIVVEIFGESNNQAA
jgi:hypothetical protein